MVVTSEALYQAFNAVFGKIGRSRSEKVILQLINYKCLLYAIDACPINKTEKNLQNLLLIEF